MQYYAISNIDHKIYCLAVFLTKHQ